MFIHKFYALHTDLRKYGLLIGSWGGLLLQVTLSSLVDFDLIDATLLRRFVYLRCYDLIQAYGLIVWILNKFRELIHLIFDSDFDGLENI